MPTTFQLCIRVHKCQNFGISFYSCNNVKLKLSTKKKSLSQGQFRWTFLDKSCPGSITLKMSSHKCYIRHRLCNNQAHFAPCKFGPILKKFIVGSIKNILLHIKFAYYKLKPLWSKVRPQTGPDRTSEK